MDSERRAGWEEFSAGLAEAANIAPASVSHESRLIDDLGIDSLALSELIVFLLVDLQMTSLESDLAKRDWTMVTVGELFDEYVRGQASPPREQFVLRAQRRR